MSVQQDFFAPLLDPDLPPPAGLCAWNGSDPARRFAVYRNNVTASLIDALADTFPVTQELVGRDFFRAMAAIYVREQPPRSRVLAFYGQTLPRFIQQFPPASSVPYLADVARLELLRVSAFHAADARPLDGEALTERLARAGELELVHLQLHPSLRLLGSAWAVASLWGAHQGLVNISTVDPKTAEQVVILRPELQVQVRRLETADFEFLTRLQNQQSLGDAAANIYAAHPEFKLVQTLAFLVRQGAIAGLSAKPGHPS
jgi:hypothetical protein